MISNASRQIYRNVHLATAGDLIKRVEIKSPSGDFSFEAAI
jgi:hypothetical protein